MKTKRPERDRLDTLMHLSDAVFELVRIDYRHSVTGPGHYFRNDLVGRDMKIGGGYYRYERRPDGTYMLRIKLHAQSMVVRHGPYGHRSAAGSAALRTFRAYWETQGGRGWHPGLPL